MDINSNQMMIYFKSNVVKKSRYYILFIFIFYFVLVTCPLTGQVKQSKLLTNEDYKLWGTLYVDKISAKARWVSFNVSYDNKLDTLFLKDTKSRKLYAFPQSYKSQFVSDLLFACMDAYKTLQILNLKDDKTTSYPNTLQYVFSKKLNNLALIREHNKTRYLDIVNNSGSVIKTIPGVESFNINESNNLLICKINIENRNSVVIINIEENTPVEIVIGPTKNDFTDFTWDNSGQNFTFLENLYDSSIKNKNQKVHHYNCKTKKLNTFVLSQEIQYTHLYKLQRNIYKFKISDDGERVFFGVADELNQKKTKISDVEVWNGNDYWLYPRQQSFDKSIGTTQLVVWYPNKNQWHKITSDQMPMCYLNGDQKYAVVFNPISKNAEFKSDGNRTLFSIDLDTKNKQEIVYNHPAAIGQSLATPSGKYLAYFKEGNWHLYNFKTGTSINITREITTNFCSSNKKENAIPYGIAGWSENDGDVYIYDQYDIWKVTIKNMQALRLTKGREQKICFRRALDRSGLIYMPNYYGQTSFKINKDHFILKAESTDHSKSGYFIVSKSHTIKKLVFEEGHMSDIIPIGKSNKFLYLKQKYNLPPMLTIRALDQRKPIEIYQSNTHYEKYSHGKSELIKYKNSKGENLQAALFYPADYDSKKLYPMIVYIYHNKSYLLHQYINPTLFDPLGFCSSNYTARGYFVLCPDINFHEGKPADSATDCVSSAVQEVVSQNLVDPKKIGIIGHSFGGYESNSIITKSGLFAAAVSGAGISDLTSYYLSVGAFKKAEIWRIENDHWMMNKSLYEDMENYNSNSPVLLAEKITTPLLLWTGKEDKVVSWNQSTEMYLALKRLNKKTIMLVYPNEQHFMMDKEHQADLTIRIQNWFDYFLKDQNTFSWIKNGI